MRFSRKSIISALIALLLSSHWVVAETGDVAATDNSQVDGVAPQIGQSQQTDTIFKFEKKDRRSLLQFKGTGNSRSHDAEDKGTFGLEALYGRFFNPIGKEFAGYYFLSGKIESDNRQRFNATFGYFPPGIGGEAKLTYRFLNAEVRESLTLGEGLDLLLEQQFEESALEQGLGVSYKKRFKIVIKELTLKYAYTSLGGESVDLGMVNLDTPAEWRRAQANAGFGDVQTHEALVEIATGVDDIDNPVLKAIRLDLGSGYQDVTYEGFRGGSEVNDSGLFALVQLKACTPAGVLKGWYQDSEAAQTFYTGYQIGGVDLYYKNIDYEYGEDEEVVGLGLTIDMFDTASAFDSSCPRFFYPSDTGYANVSQMQHIEWLASDEFTAKPKVRVVYEDVFRINKRGLPSNVRIDDSSSTEESNPEPRLIVSTGCSQNRIRSVQPDTAASAFGVAGNDVSITMSRLPANENGIIARVDDACCGDTEVTVRTVAGANLMVNSVVVREEVGCQRPPEEPTTTTTTTTTTTGTETPTTTTTTTTPSTNPTTPTTPTTPTITPTPAPLCLALGSICNQANDTCCPGTSCEFAFNTGSGSIYLCQ